MDWEKREQHILQIGILSSSLEHVAPEQMLVSSEPVDRRPDAISAVKALQKACPSRILIQPSEDRHGEGRGRLGLNNVTGFR